MVARRDGDEFTILLDDIGQPEDAVNAAQRIVDQLQLPSNCRHRRRFRRTSGQHFAPASASLVPRAMNSRPKKCSPGPTRPCITPKRWAGGTYMMLDRFTDEQCAIEAPQAAGPLAGRVRRL